MVIDGILKNLAGIKAPDRNDEPRAITLTIPLRIFLLFTFIKEE